MLLAAAGKYTLSCDTFWSGTNTANLACNLYDKSGSKQSLKLSCDISVRRGHHLGKVALVSVAMPGWV